MEKTRIYVGCGLNSAPKDFIERVSRLKDMLRDEYEVLDFAYPPPKSMAKVYTWDIEHCVRTCDLFVAICDEPSTGLGWELSETVHLDIPILAVAHKDSKVSGLVLGAAEVKQNLEFLRYEDLEKELPSMIEGRLNSYIPTRAR